MDRPKGNEGKAGIGRVTRNHNGEPIFIYSMNIVDPTNNMAEALVVKFGLGFALILNVRQLILEGNS